MSTFILQQGKKVIFLKPRKHFTGKKSFKDTINPTSY